MILTPHSAGLSKEAAIRMAISTARNVLAGIDGKLDPAMVVNRAVLWWISRSPSRVGRMWADDAGVDPARGDWPAP